MSIYEQYKNPITSFFQIIENNKSFTKINFLIITSCYPAEFLLLFALWKHKNKKSFHIDPLKVYYVLLLSSVLTSLSQFKISFLLHHTIFSVLFDLNTCFFVNISMLAIVYHHCFFESETVTLITLSCHVLLAVCFTSYINCNFGYNSQQ